MTTLIIPSRCGVPLLKRCLESLSQSSPIPQWVIIVADDDPDTFAYCETVLETIDWGTAFLAINQEERHGVWQTLNGALLEVDLSEPFVFVGQDVTFAPDWLAKAEECWREKFPDRLGLLSFNDGIQFHQNASHFMTTRRWLYVVYGEPFFPKEYWHHFCDSELTVRSRDGFDRYHYCESSRVPHHWEPVDSYSPGYNDYETQKRRHVEWMNGGLEAARTRFSEMQHAS